jgi:hypothetical protein
MQIAVNNNNSLRTIMRTQNKTLGFQDPPPPQEKIKNNAIGKLDDIFVNSYMFGNMTSFR